MHFLPLFISITGLTGLVAGAPSRLTVRDDLQPWQITQLSSHQPSGRPGNSPYQYIHFNITDSNTIPLQYTTADNTTFGPVQANCSAEWEGRAPVGDEFTCSDVDAGRWTFSLLAGRDVNGGGASVSDFGLAIKLVRNGGAHERTFEASPLFRVGDNLAGSCGGSGVCNWSLKTAPYEVRQNLTQSQD